MVSARPYAADPESLCVQCVSVVLIALCGSCSDAKRPCCSTCLRSHAYAVAHAVEGATFPDQPECTYDEGTP